MSKWVTAFGVPASKMTESIGNYVADTTLRYVINNGINGTKVRLRFSNVYGKENVKLDEVWIAEWSGKGRANAPDTKKRITFSDNGNVLEGGKELVSDAVDFVFEAGKKYTVSIYIKDITKLETGYNKFGGDTILPCWVIRGNHAADDVIDISNFAVIYNYFAFTDVEVYSSDDTYAIMAFGDSITARPWPDLLGQRINNDGIQTVSVVRKAIGGNRVLRDYGDNLTNGRMGRAAIDRFEMCIKQVAGVKYVVMLEGINDIMHPQSINLFCQMDELPTAEELIEGYKKCIDIAHEYGAKMYLCTILPCERMLTYEGDRNGLREQVNEWIRNNDYADGFIDFEKAVADESMPTRLKAEYNSGDHLHPSLEGSQKLCDTIPEFLYK